ncbi:MAG: hypothetical protein ABSE69_07900 [Roseiarcus sp.]|jgi:hypothetical protein
MTVSLAPRSQAPSAQPKIGQHIGEQLIVWANGRVSTVFRPATGRHIHGAEGIRFCTRLKTGTVRWTPGLRRGADFSTPMLD